MGCRYDDYPGNHGKHALAETEENKNDQDKPNLRIPTKIKEDTSPLYIRVP